MKVGIRISPRKGLADPQSQTVQSTLQRLGFDRVSNCSIGRWITIDLAVKTRSEAESEARKLCEKILSNPILEDVEIEILDGPAP